MLAAMRVPLPGMLSMLNRPPMSFTRFRMRSEPEASPAPAVPICRLETAAVIPDGDTGRMPPPPDAHLHAPSKLAPVAVMQS